MADKNTLGLDASVIIPIIMLFIPGIRWVGIFLLLRKLKNANILPKFKTTTVSVGTLCAVIGLIALVLKFNKYISLTVLIGGAAALGLGYFSKKRDAQDVKCKNVVGDKAYIDFDTLMSVLGCSERKLVRTLDSMIARNCFGTGAYTDVGRRVLVVRPSEYEPPRSEPVKAEPVKKAAEKPEFEDTDGYGQFLNELDELNVKILDEEVSEKIDRIRAVSNDIFMYVRNHPEKKTQIHSFTSYYLPTTIKILAAYAELEKQSVAGNNIRGSKQKIEGILDTLIRAYEQQLDLLFRAKAMDISTDIDVLETMMAKDGYVGIKMEEKGRF